MFVTVVAVICAIGGGACTNKVVTDTDANPDVTFMSCVAIGNRETSAWFANEGYALRGYRLAETRCVAGHYTPKAAI